MTDYVLLYITCPSTEVAHAIGKQLIEHRLAACVNIFPGMASLYEWQGTLEHTVEVAVIAKTTATLAADATALAVKTHPYDCPCVIELPIGGGNPDFLNWINQQTQSL